MQCFELHADELQENIRRFSMSKGYGIRRILGEEQRGKRDTSNTSSRKREKASEGVAGKQSDNEVTDENTVVPSNRMHSSSILDVTNISKEPQSKKSQVQ